MKKSYALLAAAAFGLPSAGSAAIDWTTATVSVVMTGAELASAAGNVNTGATFFSTSFIPTGIANEIFVIIDPSGGSTVGSGLARVNIVSKTGSTIASDAALNAVLDEPPGTDQDTNGLTLDPNTGIVYLLDREDLDEIVSIDPAGNVANIPNVPEGSITAFGGIVYDNGSLFYVDEGADVVHKYDLLTSTPNILTNTAAWTAVAGGTGIGVAGGPVLFGNSILIAQEAAFSGGGADAIFAVDRVSGAVSVYTDQSVFGVGDEPGISTFVVTSDGTIIAWDEFGAGAANQTFVVIPQGTGTPIRFSRSTLAAQLGLTVAASLDPSDENSMMVLTDSASQVEVLLGVSLQGAETGTAAGGIAKLTFNEAPASVKDWALYE